MHTKFIPKRGHCRSLGNRGRHREILPPKIALFIFFEKLKEAAFKVLHKNSLRDHAPHSGGKHNFIKNSKK